LAGASAPNLIAARMSSQTTFNQFPIPLFFKDKIFLTKIS
jgi:hypothetical protein